MRDEFLQQEPPETGEIALSFAVAPVARNGSTKRRHALTDAIRADTRQIPWLLSGDVQIEVEWLLNERLRYETPHTPDVDSILKPILDALRGPEGILIDDCQVQAASAFWIDIPGETQSVNVSVRYPTDLFVEKAGLVFASIAAGLYFPVNTADPPAAVALLLDHLQETIEVRARFEVEIGWDAARGLTPLQRFFHRGHLDGFECLEIGELRRLLGLTG